jgi:hypothetical protein
MITLAIDPGPTRSGFVLMDGRTVVDAGKSPNDAVLTLVRLGTYDALVIEWITVASVAGAEVYQTCRWIGRFEQASPRPVTLLPRMSVLLHLFGKRNVPKADTLVRRAMMDRYGGDGAKGTKAAPGPLYGFHADCWAALAVAVAFEEGAA